MFLGKNKISPYDPTCINEDYIFQSHRGNGSLVETLPVDIGINEPYLSTKFKMKRYLGFYYEEELKNCLNYSAEL